MHQLVLHPDCAEGPIHSVSAAISPSSGGCNVRFLIEGDIGKIEVPEISSAERTDNLWKTTCCEIFWQPVGGASYRELNLSPSTRWACYDFDDFRENGRDAPLESIAISCSHNERQLKLEADIACKLPLPADVALTAVIEDKAGTTQFWALAFDSGKPEFHSQTCRTIHLTEQNV